MREELLIDKLGVNRPIAPITIAMFCQAGQFSALGKSTQLHITRGFDQQVT